METKNLPQIWDRLVDRLSQATSESNMDMYIRQITPVKLENDVVYCTVPSTTLRSAIQQNYLSLILAAFNEITNNNNISMDLKVESQGVIDVGTETGDKRPLLKKDDRTEETVFESNINPKQRFDTFVVGNSNRFATAAAQAVASNPGNVYNPLFIYGNSGLGKTHLMYAIGNAILESNPSVKVKYVTSETFTNEIINAIKNHTVKDFQEKYRTIDCLIIDDIQFLENKERTQEEFFHTFNALKESNKQVVISCDRHPRNMDKLEERLRSRFVNGLTVDIQPPDLETRIAILRKKAETEKIDLPSEVIQAIAASIDNNVRMLEGAFNRIVAYTNLMKAPIDMQITNKVLEDFVPYPTRIINTENIINHICKIYGMRSEDLTGKKRSKQIALARQIAIYLSRRLTDASLPQIGESFGDRDHSTVIHACEKIDKMRKEDKDFDKLILQYEGQLRSF